MVNEIDTNARALWNKSDISYRAHIGGGYYASVTSGFQCVDLRKFYMVYGQTCGAERPSKRGIALRLDEWSDLLRQLPLINGAFPGLANATPCYDENDHLGQLGWMACVECNPFALDAMG